MSGAALDRLRFVLAAHDSGIGPMEMGQVMGVSHVRAIQLIRAALRALRFGPEQAR